MPSRNSYSDVMLGRPSSMITALAVVPPMSNTMRSRLAARRTQARRADHAARRARGHHEHRLLAGRLRRQHAAVGGDHPDRRRDADRAQAGFEVLQVAAHGGQQIGVHHRGAGALVFLALGQHRIGRRHQQLGEALAQDRLDALLVRGIAVAVDQADGDRLDARGHELLAGRNHARLVQRLDHAAVGRDALDDLQPMPARHQGLGLVPGEIEHVGHADAPDLQHVAEAARGDQPGPGAGALQDGVGADRGAVQHLLDIRGRNAQLPQQRVEHPRPRPGSVRPAWSIPCSRAGRRRPT